MRFSIALALALAVAGCGADSLPSEDEDLWPPHDPAAAVEACRGDAERFVLRTMPLLHGRRPLGATEVRVLAQMVEGLDARGHHGRRLLAETLAEGPDYRRRWTSELLDLLRTRRAGHRVLVRCYGERGPAADDDALADFVRDHPPTEPFEQAWTMRDLLHSSLHADDLQGLLRADLLVRMVAPIDDANTSPDDLERSRRINLGRAFEATYLGRRFECLGCHRAEASVTDHPDPALDRSWPVPGALESAVYPDHEDTMHAVFRWEGVLDGELSPWGADGCGSFSASRSDDPMPTPAALAGPLPAGATVLDLQDRLDHGLRQLAAEGWSDHPDAPQALAQLVVLHLVDGVWASVTGYRLTLDHGLPRNPAQAARLRSLAVTWVNSGYSLRALLVEIALDPHLDQAVPSECEAEGPEPLPALFEPFAVPDPERGPGANGLGHLVQRRDPMALLDEAHRLLGRPLPGLVHGEPGFDPERLAALGGYLRESQPGHEGLDLLGVLTWEQAMAQPPDPDAVPHEPEADTLTVSLDALVDAARNDPALTVGDLMIALKDRVLADPHIDEPEFLMIESLTGLPPSRIATEVTDATLRDATHRYARVLLATPNFLLSGLEQAPSGSTPRLQLPQATPAALCTHWAPRVLGDLRWSCTDAGVALP